MNEKENEENEEEEGEGEKDHDDEANGTDEIQLIKLPQTSMGSSCN